MDPSRISQVKHLFEVEHLSMRQIGRLLHMCPRTVSRILAGRERKRRSFPPSPSFPLFGSSRNGTASTLPCRQPRSGTVLGLMATRAVTGASAGSQNTTGRKTAQAYHELEFLPGEVAQVDWMEATLPFGKVYGFVFILAYSRYLFLKFYPRSSMEFFLDGHIRAYEEIRGAARRNWYDNLKSVVIKRKPELTFNATVFRLSASFWLLHPCLHPGKAQRERAR